MLSIRTLGLIQSCVAMMSATVASGAGEPISPPTLSMYVDAHLTLGPIVGTSDGEPVRDVAVVQEPDAAWMRLHFAELHLPGASRLRVTSLHDGSTHEIDASGAVMWRNTTAYFNGNALVLELIAEQDGEPFAQLQQIEMNSASVPIDHHPAHCSDGLRDLSDEDWVGRTFPAICSTGLFTPAGCMVSVAHCFDGNQIDVVQFRVPPTLPGNGAGPPFGCQIQHPPVEDQFPVTDVILGIDERLYRGDWAILKTGTNTLGETVYERYGEYRPLAKQPPPVCAEIELYGYGLDFVSCEESFVQRVSNGPINALANHLIYMDVELSSGSSGGPALYNGEIFGMLPFGNLHCKLGAAVHRVDLEFVQDAVAELCPGALPSGSASLNEPTFAPYPWLVYDVCTPIENDTCEFAIPIEDGANEFDATFATTSFQPIPEDCLNEPPVIATIMPNDAWYSYQATCTGTLTVETCGNIDNRLYLALYRDECPDPTETADVCSNDGCDDFWPFMAVATATVKAGEQWFIQLGQGNILRLGEGELHVTCTPDCAPADLNCDGSVGVADLLILIGAWGACDDCDDCPADLTGDCAVGVADLLVLINNWG